MKVSTLIKRLSEIKESYGDVVIGVDIESPAYRIAESLLQDSFDDNFKLRDIDEGSIYSVKSSIRVDKVFQENSMREINTAILTLV